MKVHLVFRSIQRLESGKEEKVAVGVTMEGDAKLIQEVIEVLKQKGFEVA